MRRFPRVLLVLLVVALAVACKPTVNVEQEKTALLAADREWSQAAKDAGKFASFFAEDGSMHPPGMPTTSGRGAIEKSFSEVMKLPNFALSWTPARAEVSSSGDIGYTVGTYQVTMASVNEKGKYVTNWKKQADGSWKVIEDIFNADAMPEPPAGTHSTMNSGDLKWGDAPPGMPAGMRATVVSGDPSKPEPYVLRAQMPANYRIAPHFHPTTENVTVLAGTVAVGMGDTFDEKKMETVSVGGYTTIPTKMNHFFMTRTASTIQIHGIGPFGITYVNASDDPRNKKSN